MALIRSATRRADWVVGLRLAAAVAVIALVLLRGIAPLVLVAVIAAVVTSEATVELIRAPP